MAEANHRAQLERLVASLPEVNTDFTVRCDPAVHLQKYDQHPEMFRQDLDIIDNLRRDAVNVREAHPSGIKKLQTYAGQLVWMGGKFPIDVCARSPLVSWPCVRFYEINLLTCLLRRSAPNFPGILRWATIPNGRSCKTTSSTNS